MERRHAIGGSDFEQAYLNSLLKFPIYITLPDDLHLLGELSKLLGFEVKPGDVITVELLKGLYGLKEAGLLWYITLKELLQSMGFEPCIQDPCLFVNQDKSGYVGVYVDDCIIAGKTEQQRDEIITRMRNKFKLSSADLTDFLGMSIDRNDLEIKISMKKYINKTLEELQLNRCKNKQTPIPTGKTLEVRNECDKVPKHPFREFLGKLLWISKARPELTYATNILCRVAHAPTEDAWKTLKRVFRYIKATEDLEIIYRRTEGDMHVTGFCDASFADATNSKSTGAGFIYLGDNLIDFYTKVQNVVATSTFEAELIEIQNIAKTILFVKRLAIEVGLSIKDTTLYTDSKVSVDVLKSFLVSKKSRHFSVRVNFVKELVEKENLKIYKIQGEENVADIGTKALSVDKFEGFRNKLYDPVMYLRRCVRDCKYDHISHVQYTADGTAHPVDEQSDEWHDKMIQDHLRLYKWSK